MMFLKNYLLCRLSTLFLAIFFLAILFSIVRAQERESKTIADRLFMPSIQMGYINHNSDVISEGLVIQTSLEYRTRNNILFRINYDDFSGRISLNTLSNAQGYSARVPLSELIGGVGYRITRKKHNVFFLVQTGIRFYEAPLVETMNGNIIINQEGKQVPPMRYTLGYEYEFIENVFLNTEIFTGHFINPRDFWTNNRPFWGVTLGLSTTLF